MLGRDRHQRATAAAIALVLLALTLGVMAAAVVAQTSGTDTVTGDTPLSQAPTTVLPQTATTATDTTCASGSTATVTPPATVPATPEAEQQTRPAARREFQSPSASDLSAHDRAVEKRRSCTKRSKLPTSGMLGLKDSTVASNVVWLQVGLKGFKHKRLGLQWAEYNVDTAGALLPDTMDRRRLDVTHDTEIRFEPVWVGYPRSGRFQVQLRVLDKQGDVVGMARTGEMRGTQYRFACAQ
jgi:hypothetical protein